MLMSEWLNLLNIFTAVFSKECGNCYSLPSVTLNAVVLPVYNMSRSLTVVSKAFTMVANMKISKLLFPGESCDSYLSACLRWKCRWKMVSCNKSQLYQYIAYSCCNTLLSTFFTQKLSIRVLFFMFLVWICYYCNCSQ